MTQEISQKQENAEPQTEDNKKPTLRSLLAAKFDDSIVKQRKINRPNGDILELDYIPGKYIIERLNNVLGIDWSFTVVDKIVDLSIRHIAILGRLTVSKDGKTSEKEQWGGTYLNVDPVKNSVISLGDDLKIATTDALKKCASQLGVALYLYDNDDSTRVLEVSTEPAKEEDVEALRNKVKSSGTPQDQENKTITEQQENALHQILKTEEATVEELLKHLKLKDIKEIPYNVAALLIIKKHPFWQ